MKAMWDWLDGRKATITTIAGIVLCWAQAQGLVDGNTANMLAAVLTVMGGVAVGHKVVKKEI